MVTAGSWWRKVLAVGSLGMCAGATNAWLCLVRLPVPVNDDLHFNWLIVPGGAIHGAVLAMIPLGAALAVGRWSSAIRTLLAAPVVGWVAGYVSWIPLHRWAFEQSWRHSLLWPSGPAAAWTPFVYFGLVSAFLFVLLSSFGAAGRTRRQVAFGVIAGILGALWFWGAFKPWYFAVIHGVVWGVAVGMGLPSQAPLRPSGELEVA